MCISRASSLYRWYIQNKNSLPDISDSVMYGVLEYLSQLLTIREHNCCTHYAYIMMKVLRLIGEHGIASQIESGPFASILLKKSDVYDATWKEAFGGGHYA